jgi:hypothetical protein
MKKTWICAALAVLQAGLLCHAESRLEPPDLGRYLRWGALRARPGLELANLGYDSNILYSAENEVPDYTATVFAKLDGLLLFGSRGFMTFDPRLGYTAYLENTDQNFPIFRVKARATLPISRYGVFGEMILNRDTERPVDLQDTRPYRAESALGLGLILEPGWRTTIEISRRRTRWAYDDPDDTNVGGGQTISDILDRRVVTDKLLTRYDAHGRTTLTLEIQAARIDFDNLDSRASPPVSKDSDAWSVLPGIGFGEGGTLSGVAKIGWTRVDAEDPELADFNGLVGDLKLAYRPVRRATIRLDGKRTPSFSVTREGIYVLNTELGLRLIYYFSRIIGLEVGGGVGQITFPESQSQVERVDDLVRYDLALRFRFAESSLGRRVEYRLRWRAYQRTSPLPSQNISRGTLGLEAVFGF